MKEVLGSTLHNFSMIVRVALKVDQCILCNSCRGCNATRLLPFGWHRDYSAVRTQLCASVLSRICGLCNECIRTVTDIRIVQHAGLTADGLRGLRLIIYIGMLANQKMIGILTSCTWFQISSLLHWIDTLEETWTQPCGYVTPGVRLYIKWLPNKESTAPYPVTVYLNWYDAWRGYWATMVIFNTTAFCVRSKCDAMVDRPLWGVWSHAGRGRWQRHSQLALFP